MNMDFVKWLGVIKALYDLIEPAVDAAIETPGDERNFVAEGLALIRKVYVHAEAGFDFDEAYAARLMALAEKHANRNRALTPKDFHAAADGIREAVSDFEGVMAAKRAARA